MILLATLAQLAASSAAKVELASASDCEIVVEVGKSEVGWSRDGPSQPFVDIGPLPDGGLYRQACDWKALGVGAPTIADPDQSGPRFAVEKPVYAADGQTAEADLNFIFTGGPGDRLFLAVRHCALRIVSDHWRLIQCRAGPIT
jgi:hypothetical protein